MFKFFFSLAVVAVVTTAMPAAADATEPADAAELICEGKWTKEGARALLSNTDMLVKEMRKYRWGFTWDETYMCVVEVADVDESLLLQNLRAYIARAVHLDFKNGAQMETKAMAVLSINTMDMLSVESLASVVPVVFDLKTGFSDGSRIMHSFVMEDFVRKFVRADRVSDLEEALEEFLFSPEINHWTVFLGFFWNIVSDSPRINWWLVGDLIDNYGDHFSSDFLLRVAEMSPDIRIWRYVFPHLVGCGELDRLKQLIQPPVHSDSMSYEEIEDAEYAARFLFDIEKRKRELCP